MSNSPYCVWLFVDMPATEVTGVYNIWQKNVNAEIESQFL